MNVFAIQTGDHVTGKYYDRPFTGTVTHAHIHAINPEMVVVVELDTPITVWNEERNAVCVQVGRTGHPITGYGDMSILAHTPAAPPPATT